MSAGGDVVLRTVGLTKRYGRRLAVDNLSIEVRRGRVYGFLGPNGSGKTTTIGMVLGLLAPAAGHSELFGLDTRTHLHEALQRVGSTIEGQSYFPHLSARDNLRVWARLCGAADARIDEVIELVDLRERSRDKVRTYSLGMKQRLAVATALLHDPDLVIFDEPTNGLDPAGIRAFRKLVHELAAADKTVFVSSHILSEVEQFCEDVGILKSGRLLIETDVAALSRTASVIELRTTDDELARKLLGALSWVGGVAREDGRLVVDAPEERRADVSRALAEGGVYLTELRLREGTLEDFFLEVTEEAASA
jgi:ABC-2 type transport system ATP-binding protein